MKDVIDPVDFRRYLLTHGWKAVEHPNQRIHCFETKPDDSGDFSSVSLPVSVHFSDAPNLLREALRVLAEHEKISTAEASDRVRRWDRDILRARMIPYRGHEESLPLAVAADLLARLKEFMGYAAYTQSNPEPFFDKAGSISSTFAKHCRFAHTFAGSFGLTIECPVPVVPELPLEGNQPTVPFERQVFERLAIGFSTLRLSVDTNSPDPMVQGYKGGFSANMCRSLAEVFQDADGRRIEYDISWSPELQSSLAPAWKPFLFEGRAYELTRVAATELEKVDQIPDSLIQGAIIGLKSETPPSLDQQAQFEHVVTMYWEREKGQPTQIRVPLSPQEYMSACDAHKEGRQIRIFGVPEKSGKFWTLTKPHGFIVLPKAV